MKRTFPGSSAPRGTRTNDLLSDRLCRIEFYDSEDFKNADTVPHSADLPPGRLGSPIVGVVVLDVRVDAIQRELASRPGVDGVADEHGVRQSRFDGGIVLQVPVSHPWHGSRWWPAAVVWRYLVCRRCVGGAGLVGGQRLAIRAHRVRIVMRWTGAA